jgi:phage protein D
MLTPSYKLTIGDRIVDTTEEPQASTVVDLTVALDMDAPTDSFTLVLGQVGGLEPERDDEATIELGYTDGGSPSSRSEQALTQVMTGTVAAVEPGLTTSRVIGYSAAATLLRTFVEQTYESKTAGQVVGDLAGRADADVAAAEDGITFPAYVVDGRRSVYHHVHDLADLCGFDLYVNADGELVFERFVGGKTVHILEYAKHIVELEVLQAPPRAESVEAWGESPGGGQAEEAWAWLTKDFGGSKGAAGSGDPKLLLERPALRTADAARVAADAAHTRIQRRRLRGRLLTVGMPRVKLGDAVRLRDVPEEALNGTFQVRSVTHRITKLGGFMTTVGFRAIET